MANYNLYPSNNLEPMNRGNSTLFLCRSNADLEVQISAYAGLRWHSRTDWSQRNKQGEWESSDIATHDAGEVAIALNKYIDVCAALRTIPTDRKTITPLQERALQRAPDEPLRENIQGVTKISLKCDSIEWRLDSNGEGAKRLRGYVVDWEPFRLPKQVAEEVVFSIGLLIDAVEAMRVQF